MSVSLSTQPTASAGPKVNKKPQQAVCLSAYSFHVLSLIGVISKENINQHTININLKNK